MDDPGTEPLEIAFERLRPYLLRVAYSHLGTLSEAEDVVQEAWLRLARSDSAAIADLRAWLTVVVGRLSLDALTSARARRERYVGPWLPEPLVAAGEAAAGQAADADPAGRVELEESLSMALLIVLESVSPAERSAFLLHDVFGYTFEEVARIVGRSPAAVRQLATRARSAVEARRPRFPADAGEQRALVAAFQDAVHDGDLKQLIAILDPDVTFRADGGGLVPAARKVFSGAERVAGILTAMARHYGDGFVTAPLTVNGAPGLLLSARGSPSVIAFTVDGGRITAIDIVRNPAKLTGLGELLG